VRRVEILSITAEKINDREYFLDVRCSKGTYIRTLCADIGAKLGCGAAMKTLERLEAGGFTIDEAISLEELEKLDENERNSQVLPVESIFKSLPRVTLSDFYARLASCGVEIYLKKINLSFNIGERVTLFDENGFFALGEVRDFEDGPAIKPIKQFRI
jgi:tRNA pseudouridine55 synthase